MEYKKVFENHPVVFGITMIFLGFGVGFTFKDRFGIVNNSASKNSEVWQESARKANWTPKSECGAYPVTIAISSPGAGSIVNFDGYTVYPEVVVLASRPTPEKSKIGFIFNFVGESNYYLTFENIASNAKRNSFKPIGYLHLPVVAKDQSQVDVWTVLVDDTSSLGSVYANIEQIMAVSPDAVVSAKTSWILKKI